MEIIVNSVEYTIHSPLIIKSKIGDKINITYDSKKQQFIIKEK